MRQCSVIGQRRPVYYSPHLIWSISHLIGPTTINNSTTGEKAKHADKAWTQQTLLNILFGAPREGKKEWYDIFTGCFFLFITCFFFSSLLSTCTISCSRGVFISLWYKIFFWFFSMNSIAFKWVLTMYPFKRQREYSARFFFFLLFGGKYVDYENV